MQLQEGPLAALSMAVGEGVLSGDDVDLCGDLKGRIWGTWEGSLQRRHSQLVRMKDVRSLCVFVALTWMKNAVHPTSGTG